MREARVNAHYLDGVALPPALGITADFDAALAHARDGLAIIATPMAGLAEVLRRMPAQGAGAPGVLWLCKGFEHDSGRLGHEVARAVHPQAHRVGVLSGPSFAIEVARGQATALVVASADASLRDAAVQALHGEALRIYTSDDVIGVEVGGAVKNVLAIAMGICDGLAARLRRAGARPERTRSADHPRPGRDDAPGRGARRPQPRPSWACRGSATWCSPRPATCRATARSACCSRAGWPCRRSWPNSATSPRACSAPIRCCAAQARSAWTMPITQAVVEVLQGRTTPAQALAQLMSRDARAETGP